MNELVNQINIVTIQESAEWLPQVISFPFVRLLRQSGMLVLLVGMTTHYLITIQGRC
jgi:hypothetical protein